MFFKHKNKKSLLDEDIVEVLNRDGSEILLVGGQDPREGNLRWWFHEWWRVRHDEEKAKLCWSIIWSKIVLAISGAISVLPKKLDFLFTPLRYLLNAVLIVLGLAIILVLAIACLLFGLALFIMVKVSEIAQQYRTRAAMAIGNLWRKTQEKK